MASILQGIKVLDLTRVIAGPLCTQHLADMGATVYKIEKPKEGDDTRRMGPFLQDAGGQDSNDSALYLAYNRGKQSITIDIASDEGADLVRQLARQCDVVVENYKVGSLQKYGLDYASLQALKPDLVYCSLTGFGQTGPLAKRPAYDFILQGMAGMMSTCGLPDDQPGGGPMRTSLPITDVVTGQNAAIAILGALFHHARTGEGQFIDCAMLDSAVALNGHLATGYLMTGRSPQRVGNTNPIASPSEVFDCADGPLIIAAGNNGQFQACCQVLAIPELLEQTAFSSNALRVANRQALRAALAGAIAHRQRASLLAALETAGVPCGPINNMAQVFAEAQTQHRDLAITLPHCRGMDVPSLRSPLSFSKTPVQHAPPPMLGQHTASVLAELLQLDPARIQALAAKCVI